jgi:hypothetical protein
MAQITQPFNEPFSLNTASLPSWFSPSVIGLNGRPYLIDNESGQYQRRAVDVVQQRNTSDARDVLLLPQDIWRQMQQSWHYGAGQSNIDRDTALPYRYEDSFGINPWDQWQISLLNTTEQQNSAGTFSGNIWLTTQGDYLCVYNGETIRWYDDLGTAETPVGTVTVSSGNDIISVAEGGLLPTVLTEDRYVWTVSGPSGTPTKWANHQYTTNVTFVDWEKDYLIVGDGNQLYNAIKSNNPTSLYTHPDTNFRWYDCASGSQFIYAIGRSGDRTTIHKIGIKTDGTGLLPAVVAATLPDGEIGNCISSYLGYLFIGTDRGVRMAQADSNGDLVLGAIIPTPYHVHAFEGQDRFVWFGKSGMVGEYADDEDERFATSAVAGLGRMDLTTFTVTSLTPAWANDIYTTAADTEEIYSIVTYNNKTVFSVNGVGVFFQTNDRVPAGWLRQGTMSFSVEDLKTALYTQVKWLPNDGTIDLDFSYDSGTYERVGAFVTNGTIRSDNIDLDGRQFSRLNATYVLGRDPDDVTDGAVMTRWEVRAVPAKGRASRWTIPILNYDTLQIDEVSYNRNVLTELDTLLDICQSGQVFTLQESGTAYKVHAKDFLWQPEKLSANGKAWQGTFTIVLEEVL